MNEALARSGGGSRLRDRLARGVAANAYAQLVTIGLQLVSIPALIAFWGVERLGQWIILTAIPAYLTIADLGFSQAGASAMSMKVAAGDTRGASHVFEGGLLLFCCICVAVGIGGGLLVFFLPDVLLPETLGLSKIEGLSVLSLLASHVIVGTLTGTIGGGLRSVGSNPWLVSVVTTGRLIEGGSTITVAAMGGGLLAAAAAMLAIKLATLVVLTLRLRTAAPWYRARAFTKEGWHQFKVLLLPSVSFLAFTLAQLLSIQGVTIAAGAIWGPATVVMLTALRTLSRLGLQAANMVTYSWHPEYSRAYGDPIQGDATIRRLARSHAQLVIPLTICYVTFSLLAGHFVIDVWTHGQVKPVEPLLTLLVLSVAIDMLWLSVQAFLIATNRHVWTSAVYIACSISLLAAVWILGPGFGVDVVGYAGLGVAVVMAVVVMAYTFGAKGSWLRALR